MPVTELTPSVESRLRAYHDMSSRAKSFPSDTPRQPTITISREFGCEGFPVAEELLRICEQTTGEQWLLVDLSLLNAVAREHNISEEVMLSLGHKPRWLDEMIATLTPHWKTDVDYYKLLCEQVVMLAKTGHAVFVGLGAAIITQSMNNCYHFRLIGEPDFRIRTLARRMQTSKQEAELFMIDKQKERDQVIRKLLDADEHDTRYYHAIYNNGKVRKEHIAATIADLVLKKFEG